MLIELDKVEAPSMLLEDFNYFFNKAIILYINLRYNIYDVNLQTSDDLRVLKATAILTPQVTSAYTKAGDITDTYSTNIPSSIYGKIWEVNLPSDYFHILNCICDFKVNLNFKCYDANTHVLFSARRLTSDMWSQIINNFYMRPMYRRPYYFIHNVNQRTEVPTNPYSITRTDSNRSSTYSQVGTDIDSRNGKRYKVTVDSVANLGENIFSDEFGHLVNKDGLWINGNEVVKKYYSSNSSTTAITVTVPKHALVKKISGYIETSSSDGTVLKVLSDSIEVPSSIIIYDTTNLTYSITPDNYTEYIDPTFASTSHENVSITIDLIKNKLSSEVVISNIAEAELNISISQFSYTDSNNNTIQVSNKDYSNLPRVILPETRTNDNNFNNFDSIVEKDTAIRYGNSSPVRMEIRYGKDSSIFVLDRVYIDYIKSPLNVRLTQEQLDLTDDTSQIMEFPDYVCQEIINGLVKLMMENTAEPRLLTNIPINLTIANPAPQQSAKK